MNVYKVNCRCNTWKTNNYYEQLLWTLNLIQLEKKKELKLVHFPISAKFLQI